MIERGRLFVSSDVRDCNGRFSINSQESGRDKRTHGSEAKREPSNGEKGETEKFILFKNEIHLRVQFSDTLSRSTEISKENSNSDGSLYSIRLVSIKLDNLYIINKLLYTELINFSVQTMRTCDHF